MVVKIHLTLLAPAFGSIAKPSLGPLSAAIKLRRVILSHPSITLSCSQAFLLVPLGFLAHVLSYSGTKWKLDSNSCHFAASARLLMSAASGMKANFKWRKPFRPRFRTAITQKSLELSRIYMIYAFISKRMRQIVAAYLMTRWLSIGLLSLSRRVWERPYSSLACYI